MIRMLKGVLIEKTPDFCVIMTGGVGYKIHMARAVYSELPGEGEEVFLYTYLVVKEDALELYGFSQRDQLAVFELVLNVSGIGPKLSLDLLSTLTPSSFYLAVLNDEENKLTKIPGIGKKSAKRIILELKERVKDMELSFPAEAGEKSLAVEGELLEKEEVEGGVLSEAKAALNSLGYSDAEAGEALKRVEPQISADMNLEEILKMALKGLKKG